MVLHSVVSTGSKVPSFINDFLFIIINKSTLIYTNNNFVFTDLHSDMVP